MAVQTPSYWQEEEYQPLVEVETAYGNKVKIPQKWVPIWEDLNSMAEQMQQRLKINKLEFMKETLESTIKSRPGKAEDLAKVLLEIY